MPESLGMKLRSAREAKGMTVDELATATKINASFINAIENGRWDLLPGRVYLKTFTKLCAEVLGLDVTELYAMIDGLSGEKPKPAEPIKQVKPQEVFKDEPPQVKKRADYKLPIVAISVLIIIALGTIFIKTGVNPLKGIKFSNKSAIPLHAMQRSGPIEWQRAWERPAADQTYFDSERLRIEATAPVWVRVVADGDTLFTGIIPADSGQTYISESGFVVSVGKNERVKAYLNGIKVPALGASEGPLRNYSIGIKENKDSDGLEN